MPPRDRTADLTLREAAAALGLSVGTVRQHVKAGRLMSSQSVGKYGPEYRIRPAVLAAFAAEHYGREVDAEALGKPAGMAEDLRELYERLLAATEEATRFKALNAANDEHYREEVARLQAERDEARAERDEERARPWWRRRRKASE